MSITLDIPPAMVQEISVYAESKGKSLAEVFMDLFLKELGETVKREEAVRSFRKHVAMASSAFKGGEPYHFNRADAYEDSPSGARNYDFP